jgi:GNAT superfamily N-acetyltransferase
VRRFTNEYLQTAPLYGRTVEELRARDAAQGQPLERWIAGSGENIEGAVSTWLRPDDRLFLFFVGSSAAIGPLSDAVVDDLGRPVHAFVDAGEAGSFKALVSAGFAVEMTSERFRVPFEAVLNKLRRADAPAGFTIKSAADADEGRLFALDNELRRDTPGTDGWVGDRQWFHVELTESPPFDSGAYLVGIEEASGRYAGLVRIWRNPPGPRFGFVGVARPYRRTFLAAALIRRALDAAAGWGHDTFVTESSLSNRVIHPRLQRVGVSEGLFHQMVRAVQSLSTWEGFGEG